MKNNIKGKLPHKIIISEYAKYTINKKIFQHACNSSTPDYYKKDLLNRLIDGKYININELGLIISAITLSPDDIYDSPKKMTKNEYDKLLRDLNEIYDEMYKKYQYEHIHNTIVRETDFLDQNKKYMMMSILFAAISAIAAVISVIFSLRE